MNDEQGPQTGQSRMGVQVADWWVWLTNEPTEHIFVKEPAARPISNQSANKASRSDTDSTAMAVVCSLIIKNVRIVPISARVYTARQLPYPGLLYLSPAGVVKRCVGSGFGK